MDGSNDTHKNAQSDDLQMVKLDSTANPTKEPKNPPPPDQEIVQPIESLEDPVKEAKNDSKFSNKKPFFQKFLTMKPKQSLQEKSSSGPKWYRRKWVIALLTILALLLIIFGWLGIALYRTSIHVRAVADHGGKVVDAIEARNLAQAKDELASAKSSLASASSAYSMATPLSYIPFLGNYVKDGSHALVAGNHGLEAGDLVLQALEPYADVLGFEGAESKLEFESAEQRIIFLADTVEKLSPQMDNISAKLNEVSKEINEIDENRYPRQLGGTEIRSKIASLKKTVGSTAESLAQFQPFIELLPDLLGNPEPRDYLILFQNDAELRPTGGFMTAYATMNVLQGKITSGVSQDIYTLDSAFTQKVPAPDPIRKYLPLVYNWNLRDMNLSPDFKVSMDTFTKYYKTVSIAPEVDAIIAIDTQVPVKLLEILGPIGVPGYGGKFSAEPDERCDNSCPQVIYELENIITRPTYEIREGRKSILGPLMNSMLANMMGSPKTKWPEFFSVFTESIQQKHLLMYFFDEEKQAAVEKLGAAGIINSYDGDYLHINDTNFAGAKSNLFVEQDVAQDVSLNGDGSIGKKLTLTYKNPAPASNCNLEAGELCLNGVLRDWIRIYVPKGSTLKASRGFEVDMTTAEDLDKTVFEGFFTLAPESVKKLEIEYTVPPGHMEKVGDEYLYKILIQKQPGTKEIVHTFTLGGGKEQVFPVNSDQELSFPR